MSVSSISSGASTVYNDTTSKSTQTKAAESSSTGTSNDAVVYEKSSSKSSSVSDSKIKQLAAETQKGTDNLKKMIAKLLSKQAAQSSVAGKKSSSSVLGYELPSTNIKSFLEGIEVDEATRLKAQQEISEDGYYGVKQTAARIMDFAMAIAGDDPDKIEEMRAAVEKGFAQAERMWGGELPAICQQTHNAVNEAFDSWLARVNGTN